ncbi:MAG: hypothetical protein AMDU3_IPLC00004G0032 [Thermoplasmatales archaeon I-plasma]|jgi:hypothetical protein|nr:MAG: hypothetical protein AMDU3_IPLC00004G0032 [Thermoplasmatales archaeon I-plasma]
MVKQKEYEKPALEKKEPEAEFPIVHIVFDRDEIGNPSSEAWLRNPGIIRALMKQNPPKKGLGG